MVTVSQVSAGRKNRMWFEIDGSEGSLAFDQEQPNLLWIGSRKEANRCLIKDPSLMSPQARGYAAYPAGHAEGYPDTFVQLFKDLYRYIAAGDFKAPRSFPTFETGHYEGQTVRAHCIERQGTTMGGCPCLEDKKDKRINSQKICQRRAQTGENNEWMLGAIAESSGCCFRCACLPASNPAELAGSNLAPGSRPRSPKRSSQIHDGFGINSDMPRDPYLPWNRWWWTRMFDAGFKWARIGQYENSSDRTSWDWIEQKRGVFASSQELEDSVDSLVDNGINIQVQLIMATSCTHRPAASGRM